MFKKLFLIPAALSAGSLLMFADAAPAQRRGGGRAAPAVHRSAPVVHAAPAVHRSAPAFRSVPAVRAPVVRSAPAFRSGPAVVRSAPAFRPGTAVVRPAPAFRGGSAVVRNGNFQRGYYPYNRFGYGNYYGRGFWPGYYLGGLYGGGIWPYLYSGYGNGYGYGDYGYGNGYDYGADYPYAYQDNTYPYNPSGAPPVAAQVGYLRVLVPDPQARLWVNGQLMQQTGTDRSFTTTPIVTGATYQIRAIWMQGGIEKSSDRSVTVTPGATVVVDFTSTAT